MRFEVRFERMRPEQIQECRQRADTAFLPVGSLEWHGLHNPIGADALKSHFICCLAAEKLGGGAVFPPLIWGLPRDSFLVGTGKSVPDLIPAALGTDVETVRGFAEHGGMDIQEQWLFYQRLLRMSLETIAGFGFRSVYLYTGHGPLVHWIRPVAVTFSRASRMAGKPVTTDWGRERDVAGLSGAHGGILETSLVMASDPTLVDLNALKRRPEYLGVGSGKDAVDSTQEKGKEWAEMCASAVAEEARWMVEHYPDLPKRHSATR